MILEHESVDDPAIQADLISCSAIVDQGYLGSSRNANLVLNHLSSTPNAL